MILIVFQELTRFLYTNSTHISQFSSLSPHIVSTLLINGMPSNVYVSAMLVFFNQLHVSKHMLTHYLQFRQ